MGGAGTILLMDDVGTFTVPYELCWKVGEGEGCKPVLDWCRFKQHSPTVRRPREMFSATWTAWNRNGWQFVEGRKLD